MVYQWKTAARIKVDANIAGAMCEQLENTIGLTPKTLLDANRPDDAPLHSEFEWDDTIAAESYRISQAGNIIRMLCVKPESDNSQIQQLPVRAYFKITESDGFEHITTILKTTDKRDALLNQAKHELDAYLRKYEQLTELLPIRTAFSEIFK